MFHALFAVIVGIAAFSAQAQVNRCTIDGKITVQQQPCPNTGALVGEEIKQRAREREEALKERSAEEKRVKEQKIAADKKASEDYEKRMKSWRAELDRYCGGRATEVPEIGMTEIQVMKCTIYHTPESVNTTKTAAGESRQYVYRRYGQGSKPEFLYFTNGRLTAMQR